MTPRSFGSRRASSPVYTGRPATAPQGAGHGGPAGAGVRGTAIGKQRPRPPGGGWGPARPAGSGFLGASVNRAAPAAVQGRVASPVPNAVLLVSGLASPSRRGAEGSRRGTRQRARVASAATAHLGDRTRLSTPLPPRGSVPCPLGRQVPDWAGLREPRALKASERSRTEPEGPPPAAASTYKTRIKPRNGENC